jgi:hypothetical protein
MGITSERRSRHLAVLLAGACAAAAVNATPGAAAAGQPKMPHDTAAVAGAPSMPHDVTAIAGVPSMPHDATAIAGAPSMVHGAARLTGPQRAVLLAATRRFRDVGQAVAAGYVPTKDCVPGMGFHYVKPALAADTNIDPTLPEVLVYTPAADGAVRLGALEYFRADADQNLKTDEDRPTLFGQPFNGPMEGHPMPPGQPPMPIHYDLHVWLYQANPSGQLATTSPLVDCGQAVTAG